MIKIQNKENCTGCSACEASCPKHCITMEEDSEGFLYPVVNKNQCINCNICEKVCPMDKKNKIFSAWTTNKDVVIHDAIVNTRILPKTYVGFINENNVRQQSTSGGIFTALANYVLKQQGAVFGVIIDEKKRIVHIMAETEEELSKIRQSKYVQSFQEGIYLQVKNELEKKRVILYTGTPCQVVGLKKFLGKEYTNLITLDIFCHGVGSPLYWEKYVSYMEKKYHASIDKVKFREKTYGYNSATMAVYFKNGKSSHKGHDDDLYWSPFSKNYIFRPSCYSCAFKQINHISDFSIGDFWKVSNLPKEYEKANGCSLLLCHSEKANKIINKLNDVLKYMPYDLEEALIINGGHQPSMLIANPQCPPKRNSFFKDMKVLNPRQLNKKYLPLSMKAKLKCIIKPVFYKIGILTWVKEIMGRRKRNES